ncbi:MAG: hypothetical protein HPY59_12475 [Anaerolineae bacterium]|nr:hypothetical protein [Anaerolineae bacterium]
MSEQSADSESLKDEFRLLGNTLHRIINLAWENPERKKIEAELMEGLSGLGDSISKSIQEFSQSEAGRQIKDEFENIERKIKNNELQDEVRSEAILVLRKINSELEKALESWKSGKENPE